MGWDTLVRRLAWPCSGPPCWASPCSGLLCCTAPSLTQPGLGLRPTYLSDHSKGAVATPCRDGPAKWDTLVWPWSGSVCWVSRCSGPPCWASPCSGPPCSGPPCSGPPCCTQERHHSQHSTHPRASLPQSISNHRVASNVNLVKGYEIPWCARARGRYAGRRRARDRRARDRRAAPTNEITLNTALVHARPPTEHLKPWSRIDHHDGQSI